mmetsp:Transcript_48233/g.75134  ORF Transcript_48233/g.75134 Transcript_48233/m.75134 type:complete len:535 (+) Transcript_48233:54-1658(+)
MSVVFFAITTVCIGSQSVSVAESLGSPSARRDNDVAPTENELKALSNDWLFHVQTTSCSGTAFDNSADSLFSRLFLPLLFLWCVFAISATSLSTGQSRAEAQKLAMGSEEYETFAEPPPAELPQADRPHSAELSTVKARLWHLDFARICAVMCVIFEHSGGEDYTHRNVIFGLWWALPYLYMTSGIGCMMSNKSMVGYVGRLACVFAVGVGANWIADVVNHRDWAGDFGNTIFQMWFVVMLVIMAILTEPLRLALQRRRDSAYAKPTKATFFAASVFGFITLTALWNFSRAAPLEHKNYGNAWMQYYSPILKHIPIIVALICGMLSLSIYAAIVSKPENTGFIGWLLLAYVYVPSVLIPWDQSGFSHLMTLYIFSMVTTVFPLAGSDAISKCVRSYWPFVVMTLCLSSMPDMWGRCDVHPPYATWERLRLNFGEFIMVVCFVTSAFAPDDPYKVTVWMGWWSLYAYCFHVMWYRLLGSPYGAVVTFSFIAVFYLLHVWLGADDSRNQNKAQSSSPCASLDQLYLEKGISSATLP